MNLKNVKTSKWAEDGTPEVRAGEWWEAGHGISQNLRDSDGQRAF